MSIKGSISTYNSCNSTSEWLLTCKPAIYHVSPINTAHISILGMHWFSFCICSESQSKNASPVTRHLLYPIGSKLAAEEKTI